MNQYRIDVRTPRGGRWTGFSAELNWPVVQRAFAESAVGRRERDLIDKEREMTKEEQAFIAGVEWHIDDVRRGVWTAQAEARKRYGSAQPRVITVAGHGYRVMDGALQYKAPNSTTWMRASLTRADYEAFAGLFANPTEAANE
jgi:hypothetical protein